MDHHAFVGQLETNSAPGQVTRTLPPFPVHDGGEKIGEIALVFMGYVGEGNVELSGFVDQSLPFAHGEELDVFDELKRKHFLFCSHVARCCRNEVR